MPCLFAAKEGRQDHGISVALAPAPAEPFRLSVRFLTWPREAQAAFTKGPAAGTLSHLARGLRMRTMLSTAATGCFLLGLALTATPAAAQGTPEQRAACEQDAYRLCSQYIPDERRTGNCLRRNRINLSPACRRLFSGGGKSRR